MSVARSVLESEASVPCASMLLFFCLVVVCLGCGCACWGDGRGLGLPDLLAARVAAMKDGDLVSDRFCLPGGVSKCAA